MEALDHYVTSPLFPLPDNNDLSDSDLPVEVLAYKKAAKKVHPIAASLPKDFCIIWCHPKDPLLSLPKLPSHPPKFTPGPCLTQEHYNTLELNKSGFLWPEEVKLAAHILKLNENALAWTKAEHG